jgi:acyl-CoA thioesterase FadM
VGDIEQWPNVVVHASIDYRKEIPLGTREVVVRTRVVDVGRSSVRFAHDVGDGAAGGVGGARRVGPADAAVARDRRRRA